MHDIEKIYDPEYTDIKDWGWSYLIQSTPTLRITLNKANPMTYCSTHYHIRKSNLFVVLEGTLNIQIQSHNKWREFIIDNTCYNKQYIAAGNKHRFITYTGCKFIEYETSLTSKDDIRRYIPGGIIEEGTKLGFPNE